MEPRSHFHFLKHRNCQWVLFYFLKKIENTRIRFSSGVKTAAAVAGGAYVGYQMGKFTGRLDFFTFSFLLYKLIFAICCTDLATGVTVEDGA